MIEGNKSAKIFEIGAGCGYQSYFLAEEDNIQLYARTEAAESYYILQSMVNSSAYGVHFKNEAYLEKAVSNFFYNKSARMAEDPVFISIPQKIRCIQYPWWAYGKATENAPFDVVTSNANLLEFTPDALDNYLEFSSEILKKDGLLLAQCCGSNAKRSFEYLKDKLIEHNYSVLFFSTVGQTIDASHIPNSKLNLNPHHPTVYNLLLSKNVHENINFRNIELNLQGANYTDTDFIARAFFGRSKNKVYTKNDFINAVEEQLKSW